MNVLHKDRAWHLSAVGLALAGKLSHSSLYLSTAHQNRRFSKQCCALRNLMKSRHCDECGLFSTARSCSSSVALGGAMMAAAGLLAVGRWMQGCAALAKRLLCDGLAAAGETASLLARWLCYQVTNLIPRTWPSGWSFATKGLESRAIGEQ